MGSFYIMQYFVLGQFIVISACFQTFQTDDNIIEAISRRARATHPWGGNRKPPDKTCLDFCGIVFDICNGGECVLDSQTCHVHCVCPAGATGKWCQHDVTPLPTSEAPPNSGRNESETINDGKHLFSTGTDSDEAKFKTYSDWKPTNTVSRLPPFSKNSISSSATSFMTVASNPSLYISITPSHVLDVTSLKSSENSEMYPALEPTSIGVTKHFVEYDDTDINDIIRSSLQTVPNSLLSEGFNPISISQTKTIMSDEIVLKTGVNILDMASSNILGISPTVLSDLLHNNDPSIVSAQVSLHSHTRPGIDNSTSQGTTIDRKEPEIQTSSTDSRNISLPSYPHMLNFTINGVYKNDTESLISCESNCTGGVCLDIKDVVSCVMFPDAKNHSAIEIDSQAFCLPGFACKHGQCDQEALDMGSVKCKCDQYWIGDFCHDRCDLDCGEHGYCAILETVNDTVGCICNWNHTGPRCETLKTFETVDEIQWHWSIVGVCLGIMVALLCVLVVVPYCMWRRRWIFVMKIVHYFQHYEEDDGKEFDAFISYKSTEYDEDFVVHTLYPKLELELGFKLCLHFRDFIPGDAIANNIINAVENSRRTIMLLTPNYVESEWCRMEYQKAQHEMLKLKHKIIPIVLKDVSKVSTLDKNLKSIMGAVTYLEWPGHDCSKQLDRFWKKLELSLPKKKQSSSASVQSSHPSLSSCDTLDSVLDDNSNDSVFSVSLPESTSVDSETSSVGQRSPPTSRLKCIVRDIFGKFSPISGREAIVESSCSSLCESLGSLSSPAILTGEDIPSTPLLKRKYPIPINCSKVDETSVGKVEQHHVVREHIYSDPTLKTEISNLKTNLYGGGREGLPTADNRISCLGHNQNMYALKTKLDMEKNILIFKSYLNTSCGNGKKCDCEKSGITKELSQTGYVNDHSVVNNSIINGRKVSTCNERTFCGVDNPSFIPDSAVCSDVKQTAKSRVYNSEHDNIRERKCVRFGDHVDFIPPSIVSNQVEADVEILESF